MADIPVNANDALTIVVATSNGQVAYDYDFRADNINDLKANFTRADDTVIALVGGVDFTASGIGTATGGTITLTTITDAVIGETISIYRDTVISRPNDYSRDVFVEDLNAEQDKIFMILQEQARDLKRASKSPLGGTGYQFSPPFMDGQTLMIVGTMIVAGPNASQIAAAQGYAEEAEYWAQQAQLGFIPDGYITDPKIAKPADPALLIDGDKIKYTDGVDTFPTPLLKRMRQEMWITDTDQITGNGTSDDTTGAERAIEKAALQGKTLRIPDDIVIRVTEPLVNYDKRGLKILGGGTEITENNNYNANSFNVRGRGSWFFLDHAGKGFQFTGRDNGANTVGNSHIKIKGIGTYRNQPAPGPGWTPGAFDYDFDFTQCTADIDDLTILNPTKGLDWKRGRAGQLNIGLIRGQPLQIGIHVQNAYDVVRVRDIHFWPFWSLDDDVMAYLRTNADAVQLARCDGPMFGTLFTFGYSRSVLFTHFAGNGGDEPAGTTYHGSFDTIYADLGGQAFAIGPEANGVTVDMKRIIAEQSTAVTTATPNVYVAGPNAAVSIGHITGNNARANVILNVGAASKILVSRFEPRIFNRSVAGFPALSAQAAGAEIQVSEFMNVFTANGAVMAQESSGGKVSGLVRRGFGTIPNGASGVAVTHGLGVTPRGATFKLFGAGAQASGGNLERVSAKDVNTFTVDIGVVATAARDFSWEAYF